MPSLDLFLGNPVSHPYLEQWDWIAQLLLVMVAVLAAWFGRNQLILFERFEMLKYIQGTEAREARHCVLATLADVPYAKWTTEQKFQASTVCASYDIIGFLIRSRGWFPSVRGRFFTKGWATSIVRTHEILEPFIEERQIQNGGNVWEDYDWLYKQALRYKTKPTTPPGT